MPCIYRAALLAGYSGDPIPTTDDPDVDLDAVADNYADGKAERAQDEAEFSYYNGRNVSAADAHQGGVA